MGQRQSYWSRAAHRAWYWAPCSGILLTILSLNNSRRRRASTCYADDTAFVIGAADENQLIRQIQRTIGEAIKLVSDASLQLSLPKTEVMVVNGFALGCKRPDILQFPLQGQVCTTVHSLKYLGLQIDNQLKWDTHIRTMCEKASQTIPRILAICSNTYGYSNEAKWVMFDGTVGAYFCYAALVFVHCLVRNRHHLYKIHRKMAINCGRLYHTVSYYTATAIANYVPLVLTIAVYGIIRAKMQGWPLDGELPLVVPEVEGMRELRRLLLEQVRTVWQERYLECGHGLWTQRLIPRVGTLLGGLNIDLAQALSGHGVFRCYLHKFRRADSPLCQCRAKGYLQHMFEGCELFRAG